MTSYNVATLLIEMTRRGIEIVAHGDRLRYRPRSAMTPDLAERVRHHKTELLDILRAAGSGTAVPIQSDAPDTNAQVTRPDDLPADWRELYEERSAVREFDGGHSRAAAEAGALRDVLTRMDEASDIFFGIKNVISLR